MSTATMSPDVPIVDAETKADGVEVGKRETNCAGGQSFETFG